MTFAAQKAHWQIATYTLTAISVVLFVTLLAVWTTKDRQLMDQFVPPCAAAKQQRTPHRAWEQTEPCVLSELTPSEIQSVLTYLFTVESLALTSPDRIDLNSSFIFYIQLKRPAKADVLAYLDQNGTKPLREASVMIFRGDLETPVVAEYTVGVLPTPTYCRLLRVPGRRNPVPYHYRPFTIYELMNFNKYIITGLTDVAYDVLLDSYNASLLKCGSQCLSYSVTPVSSAYLHPDQRMSWLSLQYKTKSSSLHPVDFQMLINVTSQLPEEWSIAQIWYANQLFESLEGFVQQYKDGVINKSRFKFPSEESSFGTMGLSDDPHPEDGSRGPRQYSPDGPRYTIHGDNIRYMRWSFNYSVSPSRGIQLFDVKFQGERIVYELSMQEIVVLYSGHSPAAMYGYYADGAGLFGVMPKGLVPGYDCPSHASYIETYMYNSKTGRSSIFPNAICVFEHSNETPLRRHKPSRHSNNIYGALNDDVLIFRAIISVVGYDYVYDFIFHLNGVLQVRVSLSGYVTTHFYYPQEDFYGTKLTDTVVASLHNHLFHFKVDMDIKGVANRFQTLDIDIENITVPWSFQKGGRHIQKLLTQNLKSSEKEAAYKYDFEHPKYLLFSAKSRAVGKNPKSYRILMSGMSKSLLPEGYGFEKSVPWARYQAAVTKYHDDEDSSTSVFSMWDAREPVIDFQSYIDDDENIVDQVSTMYPNA